MTDEESVTIPKKKYEELLEAYDWLVCLEAAGVDSWEGIEEAQQILDETT